MNKEKIFFITGIIFLTLGVLIVTLLPFYIKNIENLTNSNILSYFQILFFLLAIANFFASLKYYKFQINFIILLICYYIIYCKIMS